MVRVNAMRAVASLDPEHWWLKTGGRLLGLLLLVSQAAALPWLLNLFHLPFVVKEFFIRNLARGQKQCLAVAIDLNRLESRGIPCGVMVHTFNGLRTDAEGDLVPVVVGCESAVVAGVFG